MQPGLDAVWCLVQELEVWPLVLCARDLHPRHRQRVVPDRPLQLLHSALANDVRRPDGRECRGLQLDAVMERAVTRPPAGFESERAPDLLDRNARGVLSTPSGTSQ